MASRPQPPPPESRRCVHVVISGKVQGVWYRASGAREASREALTGWIRNCDTGVVEALVCGRESAVVRWLAWCRKGPIHADVESVIETEVDVPEGLASFLVRGNVPEPGLDA
ncbi:MAG: acylphosphatase [Pseudomonadota bacterium]